MLTHLRYTVAPPKMDEIKAARNEVEIEGLRRAYLHDGASFVCAIVLRSSGKSADASRAGEVDAMA
jgi:Xaa-Pro aminopeptidase